MVTYNGDLPQENSWADSWEEFFINGFKHVVEVNVERAGKSDELNALLPSFYANVIPRLLRPLETGDNNIKPSLVHGDLWCGNAAVDQSTGEGIVFDPSSFWAHNECKGQKNCQTRKLTGLQTSLGIGGQKGTSFLVATFTLITPISQSHYPRKITTIGTPFTPCMLQTRVGKVPVLTTPGDTISMLQLFFPESRAYGSRKSMMVGCLDDANVKKGHRRNAEAC